MKTEISFRVWDKRDKIMYQDQWTYIEFDRKFRWFLTSGDGGGKLLSSYARGVLMLFTGLYDKHGKKIYDGDLLTNFGGISHPTVVELEPEGKFYYWWGECSDPYNETEDIEVVGNIYENPELLDNN